MSTKAQNKQTGVIDRSDGKQKASQKGRNQQATEGVTQAVQATEQDKPVKRTRKQSKPVQGNLGAVQGDIKTQECNSTVAQANNGIEDDLKATAGKPETASRQSMQDGTQDALNGDIGHLGALKDDLSVHDMRALVKANSKPKKQVFSFRGSLDDIKRWKAYSAVTGRTMESIGVTAINEYIKRHKLTQEQQQAFDLLVKD